MADRRHVPLKFSKAKAVEALEGYRASRKEGQHLGLLSPADDAQAVAMEAGLREAVAAFAQATSWGEAAALLMVIAADAKQKSGDFSVGRPAKNDLINKFALENTAFKMRHFQPNLSPNESIDVLVSSVREGRLQLTGTLPAEIASRAALRKRVVRALGPAKWFYRRKT